MMPTRSCTVPGCTRPHKGHGFCIRHYELNRRNGSPTAMLRPNYGSGFVRNGYKYVVVDGRERPEHVVIAEAAIGRSLPPGSVVHHADGTKENRFGNLVVCPSRAYHNLLHQRIDALNACGDPSWRKCVFCKQYDAPENLVFRSPPSQPNGSAPRHLACERTRFITTKE
jgi:hypothetical protein